MLRLILGRAGTGKASTLFDRIISVPESKKVIVLVPGQFSVSTERALLEKSGGALSANCEVMGFRRFAEYILSKTGGAASFVDGDATCILMHHAMKKVSGELTSLRGKTRQAGFSQRLVSLYNEFTLGEISPARIKENAEGQNGLSRDKLLDLSKIFEEYETLLSLRGRDPIKIYELAKEKLSQDFSVMCDTYLFVDGFKEFSHAEEELLKTVILSAKEVCAAFCCDGIKGTRPVFRRIRSVAKRLSDFAEHNKISVDVIEQKNKNKFAPGISYAEEILCDFGTQKKGDPEGISFTCAANAYDEISFAAENICRLVRENGYRFRDFTIIARSPEQYKSIIAAVFPKYNIPFYNDIKNKAATKSLFTAVLSLFAIITKGFTYSDVFSFLKCGLANISESECDILENYAYSWDIRGKKSWESDFCRSPKGFAKDSDKAKKAINEINEIRKKAIAPVLNFLQAAKGGGAKEISGAIYSFLCEISAKEKLKAGKATLEEMGELKIAQEYAQIYDIMIDLLDKFAKYSDDGISIEEYFELFKLFASEKEIGTIPTANDEVVVGGAEDIRRTRGKCTFIIGFATGVFPKGSSEQGILSTKEREAFPAIRQNDIKTLSEQECFYVYSSVVTAAEKLFISFPRVLGGTEGLSLSYIGEIILNKLNIEVEYREEKELKYPKEKILRIESLSSAASVYASLPSGDELKAIIKQRLDAQKGYKDVLAAPKNEEPVLGKEAAEKLYNQVNISPTSLEKFAKCKFAYYCEYGLKAKKREKYGFAAAETGTFVHFIFEKAFAKAEANREIYGYTGEKLENFIDSLVLEYINEYLPDLESFDARFQRLFARVKDAVYTYLLNAFDEFSKSKFRPAVFELSIGKNGDVMPLEYSDDRTFVSLKGIVDRVDTYEKDGKLYFRIVDYKTGKKYFSFKDVSSGLSLQLLLYLFAIAHGGKSYFGKEMKPAGVLYSLVKFDAVHCDERSKNKEQIAKMQKKETKGSGLLLDDIEIINAMDESGEFDSLPVAIKKDGNFDDRSMVTSEKGFEKLEEYIKNILLDSCAAISEGEIEISPLITGSGGACEYCDMNPICRYEGDKTRKQEKVEAKQFLEFLKGEEDEQI